MGTVIRFPERARRHKPSADMAESATVVILPVIRIERFVDEPAGRNQRRRGRRRASRP